MTFKEFKVKVCKRNFFDKYWYYALSIVVTVLALICFYCAFKYPEKFTGSPTLFYMLFFILLLLGLYGFYLLPNRYKIVEIDSSLSINAKRNVLKELLDEFGTPIFTDPNHYIFFRLKTKWWQGHFDVHLFYDESKFAFSLQGHDFDGGFIDLGGTERKRKKLKQKIQDLAA